MGAVLLGFHEDSSCCISYFRTNEPQNGSFNECLRVGQLFLFFIKFVNKVMLVRERPKCLD